jgi:hypothetical protein
MTKSADEIVMMPPYVEPEHRHLIEMAEAALEEYSAHLIELIKVDLFDSGWTTEPDPAAIRKAEQRFHEDPVRMRLVKHLSDVRIICERPRFMIKAKYAGMAKELSNE